MVINNEEEWTKRIGMNVTNFSWYPGHAHAFRIDIVPLIFFFPCNSHFLFISALLSTYMCLYTYNICRSSLTSLTITNSSSKFVFIMIGTDQLPLLFLSIYSQAIRSWNTSRKLFCVCDRDKVHGIPDGYR